jgi:hypothetical protein
MRPKGLESNTISGRESAMRRTDANGRTGQNFMITMKQTCSLVAICVSLGLAMSAGPARAGDDDRTFTEKVSDGFYGMIRGTNMDNRGIDYRERSPLVVPPTLDLPPPAATSQSRTGRRIQTNASARR